MRTTSYASEDLVWLRDAFGSGHLELDPWGNLIVSPASEPHEWAIYALSRLLFEVLDAATASIYTGWGWRVPSGSGYLNVPDILVLAPATRATEGDGLTAPPLLLVEVASPTTRTVDRTRKAADYELGGVATYLLVDLPGLAPVLAPTVEVRTAAGTTAEITEPMELEVAGRIVTLDPVTLLRP